MSLMKLMAVDPSTFDLLSVDLFDTVLLRDFSLQRQRFLEAAAQVAGSLEQTQRPVSAATLFTLRSVLHGLAYRAVTIERPAGDANATRMHGLLAHLLGRAASFAALLGTAELEVERKRLSPNRRLLTFLSELAASGKRIVAISDTYYKQADVEWIIAQVVGPASPIARVYASCDLGLTKRSGEIFQEVAVRENVATTRILHCGDDRHADVDMARAAGCQAIHLPRPRGVRLARKANAVQHFIRHAAAFEPFA